jgi:hypothetical protein
MRKSQSGRSKLRVHHVPPRRDPEELALLYPSYTLVLGPLVALYLGSSPGKRRDSCPSSMYSLGFGEPEDVAA